MGKSPLILAALAKDAAPALNFVQVTPLTGASAGMFDSALLASTTGTHYVVKMPRGQYAALSLDTELVVLRALSAHRNRLPFELTKLVGETKDSRGKRALVFTYVYGQATDLTRLGGDDPLAGSLADALAAIHSLPLGVVEDSGLPQYSPADVVRMRVAELDRAAATGKVPAVLLSRWEAALEDVNLWRFNPTVVHGDVIGDNFVQLNGAINGILGWHHLCISDPASDFSWILDTASDEFAYNVLLEYSRLRGNDENLRARAQLYSEMEFARYLMHGLETGDDEAVEVATDQFNIFLADLEAGLLPPVGPKPLAPVVATFGGSGFEDATAFSAAEFEEAASVSAAEFVDVAQSVVTDDLLLDPSAGGFEPASFVENNVFAKSAKNYDDYEFDSTAPRTEPVNIFAAAQPVELDDATTPIEIVSVETVSVVASADAVSDATTPIAIVADSEIADSSEAEVEAQAQAQAQSQAEAQAEGAVAKPSESTGGELF